MQDTAGCLAGRHQFFGIWGAKPSRFTLEKPLPSWFPVSLEAESF